MRLFLCLILILSLIGCSNSSSNESTKPESDTLGKNTPLNEEVDEVSKVQDEVMGK